MKFLCIYSGLLIFVCNQLSATDYSTPPNFSLDSRIVGGRETTIEEHPYQATIEIFTQEGRFRCGGSIIASWWILTAAHCVYDKPYKIRVRVGSKYKTRGKNTEVASYAIHPSYDPSNSDKDVAVLRLGRELMLNERSIRPIQLAESEPLPNSPLTITGWGTTIEDGNSSAILMEVTIPVVSRGNCSRLYKHEITSNMICAGLKSGGKDSCQGDSGGPAVSDGGELVGVVSFGRGCARAGSPGVYVSVAAPAGDSGGPAVSDGGELVGVVSFGRGCARAGSPGVYVSVAAPAVREWIYDATGV